MIFFDESGKRWKRIKLSSSLLTSTLLVSVAGLVLGIVFYFPQWGSLSLAKPFGSGGTGSDIGDVSGESTDDTAVPETTSSSQTSTGSKPNASLPSITNANASTTNPAAAPAVSTTTTNPSPTPTSPAPASPTPLTVSPPAGPGNSDYGQSHHPVR